MLELVFSALAWVAADWDKVNVPATGAILFWSVSAAFWAILIAISIGLLFFRPIARIFYVALVPVLILIEYWYGYPEGTRAQYAFDYLASLCVGAILCAMWLSPPIAGAFASRQPNPALNTDAGAPRRAG
jgi:hypothetical protein